MRDDTIYEDDDVKEAIRRLPENLYNDRMFRIKRALDLSMRQQILPKEQWTKYEEVAHSFFVSNSVVHEGLSIRNRRKTFICLVI